MSLDELFLKTRVVDEQTRCHCGGELVTTRETEAGQTVVWGTCQACGDFGVLTIAGTDRSTVPLWRKP